MKECDRYDTIYNFIDYVDSVGRIYGTRYCGRGYSIHGHIWRRDRMHRIYRIDNEMARQKKKMRRVHSEPFYLFAKLTDPFMRK